MNYLIAKVKRKREFLRVLSSDSDIFSIPEDIHNKVDYDPAYKLEDDEWFVIKEFSNKEFSIDLLNKPFISADLTQISIGDYSKISVLCSIQDSFYYFQKIYDNYIIRKKFFSISQEPRLVEDEPIIVINITPDAIYDRNNDILYFKKLSTISSIFKGIDTLYKEATQEETEQFLNSSFLRLNESYSASKVSTPNRKRIALAMDTLSNYSDEDQNYIFSYIKEYCEELEFSEDESFFRIGNDDDLKKLLYGIEQRYYTTALGGQRRLANSIMVLAT